MGNRYSANTKEPTTLLFQFVVNDAVTDAFQVRQVTIHPTFDDADNNTNILRTVPQGSITKTSTGTYEYTVSILSTSQTYYDKIFLTPTSTGTEINFINSFVVNVPLYTGRLPGDPGTCRITGILLDHTGYPLDGARIYGVPVSIPSIIRNRGIIVYPSMTISTSTGEFFFDLPRGMQFDITIKELGLTSTVLVPDIPTCELWSLIGVGQPSAPPDGDPSWP